MEIIFFGKVYLQVSFPRCTFYYPFARSKWFSRCTFKYGTFSLTFPSSVCLSFLFRFAKSFFFPSFLHTLFTSLVFHLSLELLQRAKYFLPYAVLPCVLSSIFTSLLFLLFSFFIIFHIPFFWFHFYYFHFHFFFLFLLFFFYFYFNFLFYFPFCIFPLKIFKNIFSFFLFNLLPLSLLPSLFFPSEPDICFHFDNVSMSMWK